MVEDLIVKFRLKDFQLMILSFFYGTIYITWVSGVVFFPPLFLGVNWFYVFFVNIIWWGAIQAVLTFYLANLAFKRDWNHPQMSFFGWFICLLTNFIMIMLFQQSGIVPFGTPLGKLTIFSLLSVSFFLNLIFLRRNQNNKIAFCKSPFLNYLCYFTVILFFFSAIFLIHDPVRLKTSNVNATSVKVIGWWSLILSLILLGHRLFTKKEISV